MDASDPIQRRLLQDFAAASSGRDAQLRSRFKAAGLWSEWASGGDSFAKALSDFPAEVWARHGICPPQRTIMLAATSKSIQGLLAQLQRQVPARTSETVGRAR